MSKTAVLAKLPIKKGEKDTFLAAFAAMYEQVEQEPGTEIYILNWDRKDENLAYLYEVYTDKDALKAHSGSDAMQAFQGALAGILAGAPELIMLTPDTGKGL